MSERAGQPADGDRGLYERPAFADDRTPSAARTYDYLLGGKDNFQVDRQAGELLSAAIPGLRELVQDARHFLGRVVPWLVREAGIRQFIDLGSGLPTVGNVHEIAQAAAQDARVVYSDHDSTAVSYGRALLSDETTTRYIAADIRDPDAIFTHPDTTALIDLDRPFAVLGTAVFHHLTDDEVYAATQRIRSHLRPGCYVVYDDLLDDDNPQAKAIEHAATRAGFPPFRVRTWEEHRRFFDGLEIVEPGLVYLNEWRPDHHALTNSSADTLAAAAVARMPG